MGHLQCQSIIIVAANLNSFLPEFHYGIDKSYTVSVHFYSNRGDFSKTLRFFDNSGFFSLSKQSRNRSEGSFKEPSDLVLLCLPYLKSF